VRAGDRHRGTASVRSAADDARPRPDGITTALPEDNGRFVAALEKLL
jgi:hypothetical protein